MKNLDFLAARYGQQIGFSQSPLAESVLNDALNILHSQGIYALFLWLYEKPDERGEIGRQIQRLFSDSDAPVKLSGNVWSDGKDRDQALKNVASCFTENLKTMFLAKDLIAHTLTYARHASKARGDKGEKPTHD